MDDSQKSSVSKPGAVLRRVVVLLLLFPTLLLANEEYVGSVVKVADGDTITVLVASRQVKVRLADIDTPEQDQPFGNKAKQALGKLVFDKEVKVVKVDTDRYGRLVGRVYRDGLNINATLVNAGYAWVYRKYSDNPELLRLEAEAREAQRGLWAQAGAIPPWEWRRGKRASGAGHGKVIGNKRSGIYHLPDCPDYGKVAEHNQVLFETGAQADAAGFRIAGNCP